MTKTYSGAWAEILDTSNTVMAGSIEPYFTVSLPATGTYMIRFTSCVRYSEPYGFFLYSWRKLRDESPLIQYRKKYSDSVDYWNARFFGTYHIGGTAGDNVNFRVSTDSRNLIAAILDSSFSVVVECAITNPRTGGIDTTVTLPATGKYTIQLYSSDFNAVGSSYSFALDSLQNQMTESPVGKF